MHPLARRHDDTDVDGPHTTGAEPDTAADRNPEFDAPSPSTGSASLTSTLEQAAAPFVRRPELALAVVCFILFLTFLDNTIISATLADIQSSLHAGVTQLQWVVGAYALTFASLMLLGGTLGDLFGRKRLMLIGVVVFCAGSVLGALAPSPSLLIAGRAIMGIGAAGSEPGTLSVIRHLFPERRGRAVALGVWAAVSGLALAMGPVFGGILVGVWSWRAVFWFNLVMGALAFVGAAVTLPETSDFVRARLDVGGFVLGAVAVGSATFATIAGETSGYRTWWVVALYVVAFVALAFFVPVELRARDPMLNLRFFERPPFAGSTLVAFTSYFGIFSIFFFVALYLEVVGSTSPFHLALDFVPMTVGMVLASIFAGRWVSARGMRVPMIVGCLTSALGLFLTDALITPHSGLSSVGWTLAIAGIGFGIVIVPVTSSALTSVPAEHSGMAASATNTSRELGAVAAVAVLGSLVNGQLTVRLIGKLAAIGIPASYRQQVLAAVTTGSLGSQAKAFEGKQSAAVKHIIDEVVNAAYGAFSHGLDLALSISGALLLASGIVVFFAIRPGASPEDADSDEEPVAEPS